MKDITDATFEEETKDGLVLTDFWATWCGPCKIQGPVLEELDEEIGDKIKFTKLEVDENQETPGQLGIMAIPTMILKKDGEIVERLTGFHPKEQLQEVFDQYLAEA